MTPKEKAKELVEKMYQYQWRKDTIEFKNAKQCALIAVDEIINCDTFFKTLQDSKDFADYWYKVQQEIEKL